MGLLTGFSIITAVEIVYFTTKIIIGFFKKIPRQTITKISMDSKIAWISSDSIDVLSQNCNTCGTLYLINHHN